MRFGERSEAVTIVIGPKACPWIGAQKAPACSPLLLTAFIAGNVLSQLDSGVKGDDAYSGLIQVLRVYRQLRRADPTLSVPEVDRLLGIHRKGGLAAALLKPAMEPAKGRL